MDRNRQDLYYGGSYHPCLETSVISYEQQKSTERLFCFSEGYKIQLMYHFSKVYICLNIDLFSLSNLLHSCMTDLKSLCLYKGASAVLSWLRSIHCICVPRLLYPFLCC